MGSGGNAMGQGAQPKEPRQATGTQDLLGFTFHLSWMFLFLYLQEPGSSAEIAKTASPSPLYLASTLALAATLGAFAAKPAQLCGLMTKRRACFGAAVLTALGTAAYCTALALGWHVGAFAAAGGVLTGIGSGALAAQWAWAFSREGIAGVLGATPAILAGAIALCVTLPYLPRTACMLIVCVLPLLSGMFVHRAAKGAASEKRAEAYDDAPGARHRRCYLALVVFAALLGTILGCLNVSTHSPLFAEYIALFFMTAAVAVLSACIWHLNKRSQSELIIAGIVPICAIVCLLVLLMRINENDFFSSFIPIGSTCLEMLFLATLVIFSIRFRLSTVRTFAIGRISYALFYLVGTAVGTQLNIAGSETATVQATSFLLFADIELVTAAAVIGLVFARQTTRGTNVDAAQSKQIGVAENQGGRMPAASASAHVPDMGTARVAAPASPNENAKTAEVQNECNPVNASDPGSPSKPAQAHPSTSPNDTPAPAGELQPKQSAMQSGKFERRVVDFAETYGLSARETDVLRQLLKGRGYARIQQELSIAEGTVNYHVRNIYAKTNVHSREKLVDLFDDLE